MTKMNDRLTIACDSDPTIVTPRSRLSEVEGHTEDHMLYLGLTKGDLLRMERAGLAIRGYTPGTRHKRWILIGDDSV